MATKIIDGIEYNVIGEAPQNHDHEMKMVQDAIGHLHFKNCYSLKELSKLFNRSLSTLRMDIKKGKIWGEKINGKILVHNSYLHGYRRYYSGRLLKMNHTV